MEANAYPLPAAGSAEEAEGASGNVSCLLGSIYVGKVNNVVKISMPLFLSSPKGSGLSFPLITAMSPGC